MINRLLLFLSILTFTGCAGHYHRHDGEDLTLILAKPDARSVVLFSSIDGFQPRSAVRISGRWTVRLPADRAFAYFYRVDGVLYLPDCPVREKDDFGSENCIYDPHL